MSTLSIFVDESGDFGTHSDYYVIALVMHDQSADWSRQRDALDRDLRMLEELPSDQEIHTGPAIRGEDEYRGVPVETRKRGFDRLFAFAREVPVTHKIFSYRKREYPERAELKAAFSQALGHFMRDNAAYFLSFDKVTVYYDNGQADVTDVLTAVLKPFFFDIDFRLAAPSRYRLFQVADLHCTLELLRLKSEENRLSRSDMYFLGSRRRLQKNYLTKLDHKQLS